jgi:hypothetical protein
MHRRRLRPPRRWRTDHRHVTLSDKLKSQVSPDDTVFIFARAVEGPRMPLAIIRKQVKDLPFEFKLDDSMAMSPDGQALGRAAGDRRCARVSKSGNANAAKRRPAGLSTPVVVGARGVKIEIADTVGKVRLTARQNAGLSLQTAGEFAHRAPGFSGFRCPGSAVHQLVGADRLGAAPLFVSRTFCLPGGAVEFVIGHAKE